MTAKEWLTGITFFFTLLQWALVPHLLAQRNKSPNAILAWLWAILLFPIAGGVFYLLVGSARVERRHARRASDIDKQVRQKLPAEGGCEILGDLKELAIINGFPSVAGNDCDVLPDGTVFFPLLLEAIQSARHHIHTEFYIWANDKTGVMVRDALAEAAKRGVEVRILLDEMGSLAARRSFFKPVLDAGGKFSWFNTFAPLKGRFHLNLRNHRKLLIVDGQVAFTGGMNVGSEYWMGRRVGPRRREPAYRDVGVRLRGPVVEQLAEVFAQDWFFATGETLYAGVYYPDPEVRGGVEVQVVPGGPDNDLNEIQLTTLAMLQRAKRSIRIMTPYFVPENALLSALQLAAMRGVEVSIIVPAKGDHAYLTHVTRAYYDDLLPYGIKIYEYQPRLLHAKVTVIDGRVSMCGSANMDVRSLRINFELNVVLAGEGTGRQFQRLFENNLKESKEITEELYRQRPFRHKLAEVVFRPLASLL